jgi:hypothetical protein
VVALDHQVSIGRRHIHRVGHDALAVAGERHMHRRGRLQHAVQLAREMRGEMLYDEKLAATSAGRQTAA